VSHFAPPKADPHGLRDAARRLTEVGRDLDAGGQRIASTGTATLGSWQGSASLLMAARARELRRVTQQKEQVLRSVAQATERYADEVEQAKAEVRRLNELWEEAVRRAQQQAAAAAAARESAERQARAAAEKAAAAGERAQQQAVRHYDDGSAALAETQAQLEQRYRRLNEDLEQDGYSLERVLVSRDPITFLPAWMAGGVYSGQAAFKTVTSGMKAAKLARYSILLRQASQFYDLGNVKVAKAIKSSAEFKALSDALYGKTSTTRFVGGAMTKAGKVFLPLTLVSGALDIRTGGGYDGWRDPATRVAGAVGVAGAGALLISASPILFTLGPVGVAVAGAAVLAYGAYSIGSFVYDNRKAIAAFGNKVRDGVVRGVEMQVEAAKATVGAAKDVLAAGAGAVKDAGEKVVDVITSPTKLLPKVGDLF
jgi:uncharacterized protein YukE